MAVWTLKAHPRFERDLKKLSKVDKKQLAELILRIKEDPYRFKTLKGCSECFRVRFSNFRRDYSSMLIGLLIAILCFLSRKITAEYAEERKSF